MNVGFCHKFFDEEDGVMCLVESSSFMALKLKYVFQCKNCMSEKLRERFREFKKKGKREKIA